MNKKAIVVLYICAAIIFITLFFLADSDDKNSDLSGYKIVENYSDFYTVNSCANKYVSFLAAKQKDSLISVLSSSYKKEHNINLDNVLDNLPMLDTNSTFVSKKMYYKQYEDNNYKFYVYGFIEKNDMNENYDEFYREEMYLIVYIDKNQTIFSVEPYDGDSFINGDFK